MTTPDCTTSRINTSIPGMTAADVDRFWSKIDRSGGPDACWPWVAGTFDSGYGSFCVYYRSYRAHRIAWELTHGPIPSWPDAPRIFCCHHCDNPPCCNPAHLFLGTTGDNMRDASRKGRTANGKRNGQHLYPERRPRGERHGSRTHPEKLHRGEQVRGAKLTEADVVAIRAAAALGNSQRALGRQFGVAGSTIYAIVHRATWAHVPEQAERGAVAWARLVERCEMGGGE